MSDFSLNQYTLDASYLFIIKLADTVHIFVGDAILMKVQIDWLCVCPWFVRDLFGIELYAVSKDWINSLLRRIPLFPFIIQTLSGSTYIIKWTYFWYEAFIVEPMNQTHRGWFQWLLCWYEWSTYELSRCRSLTPTLRISKYWSPKHSPYHIICVTVIFDYCTKTLSVWLYQLMNADAYSQSNFWICGASHFFFVLFSHRIFAMYTL